MPHVSATDWAVSRDPSNTVRLRHPVRIATALLCLLGAAWFAYALATNPNIDWGDIGEFLFFRKILEGVVVTLKIAVLATVVGLSIGVVLAIMKLSANPVARWAAASYIWFFRGTPVLVQLIFWFNLAFLFPELVLRIPFTDIGRVWDTNALMTGFNAAMLGLALNLGAYSAETVRAGIQAVDPGQREAAAAVGMSSATVMRVVVLPQATRIIIPPLGNEFISMMKTTSLVYVVAGNDLMTNTSQIYKQNGKIMELLIVASIWYMALTVVATFLQNKLEQRMSQSTKTVAIMHAPAAADVTMQPVALELTNRQGPTVRSNARHL